MIDLSAISKRTLLGKVLRAPLRLIPRGIWVRVLQGPLKGARWIVGSATHGCWLGSFELAKQELFAKYLALDYNVFDIGANVGFYTILASRLVGNGGEVVAFEPLPRNVRYLRQHVEANGLTNVKIVEAAVGAEPGTARFSPGSHSSMGSVSNNGELEVELVSLDALYAVETLPVPDLLKIDVEGAELDVLMGARGILRSASPVIFLATHGADIHTECMAFLRGFDYDLQSISSVPLDEADELIALPPGFGKFS